MAADLDGQDWLDMDNIEQVKWHQHVTTPFVIVSCVLSALKQCPVAASILRIHQMQNIYTI